MDVVVFASAYWDEPLWTNKQHVASRLAARHRVLYVEPGFSRSVLMARLTGRAAPPPVTLPEPRADGTPGLARLSPLDLPLRRGPDVLRALAYRELARRVRNTLAAWRSERFAYLVYYPEGVRLIEHLRPAALAYDCVDDLVTQPHFARNPALAASLAAAEARLVREADVVLATSPALAKRLAAATPRAHYVPNVADFEHFARPAPEPAWLARVPRPRVAFSGALDPYKLDYALLGELLERAPDLHFVLIGPASTAGPNPELARLPRSRVHAPGLVPYGELPAWLHAMDALVMPYVLSEHTRHIFPLKAFEYLATGRPVIATPLDSLATLPPVFPRVAGGEAFAAAVRDALADPARGRDERVALARANTWETRVRRIEELLEAALAARARAAG